MEQQGIGWGPVAAVALIVVLLNLTGMLWLGVSQERARADIARLARQIREKPAGAPDELKAIRDSLAALSAKVDGLAATADPKAVARLVTEVKNLSNRINALTKAKRSAPSKTAASAPKAAKPRPLIENPQPPRPFYGPGYPVWPGY